MKPLKSKVSITLDSDVIEKIKFLAEQDDRSFSQSINMILKEYLNQTGKIKETSDLLCFFYFRCYATFYGMLSAYISKK